MRLRLLTTVGLLILGGLLCGPAPAAVGSAVAAAAAAAPAAERQQPPVSTIPPLPQPPLVSTIPPLPPTPTPIAPTPTQVPVRSESAAHARRAVRPDARPPEADRHAAGTVPVGSARWRLADRVRLARARQQCDGARRWPLHVRSLAEALAGRGNTPIMYGKPQPTALSSTRTRGRGRGGALSLGLACVGLIGTVVSSSILVEAWYTWWTWTRSDASQHIERQSRDDVAALGCAHRRVRRAARWGWGGSRAPGGGSRCSPCAGGQTEPQPRRTAAPVGGGLTPADADDAGVCRGRSDCPPGEPCSGWQVARRSSRPSFATSIRPSQVPTSAWA